MHLSQHPGVSYRQSYQLSIGKDGLRLTNIRDCGVCVSLILNKFVAKNELTFWAAIYTVGVILFLLLLCSGHTNRD